MVSLTKALEVARTTRNAFNYWRSAGLLTTRFSETTPGVARSLSRKNVLEIAIIAAITETGLAPKDAKAIVMSWLMADQRGESLNFVARRYDAPYSMQFQNITTDDLAYQLGAMRRIIPGQDEEAGLDAPAVSYSVINLGEVRRRVDALFSEAEHEKDN